ncbi:MAG: hypothetical protein ABI231_11950 [Candidatus Tumulicola sp.]
MTLREIPAALALGLLASLAAHTVLYGGEHAMGGAYHDLLLQVAAAGSVGFVALLGTFALTGSHGPADGSILGARLASRLPGLGSLAASAAMWFALGEHVEAAHSGTGLLLTVVVLVAAAWSFLTLAHRAVRLLANAIIAIARLPFAARTPLRVRPARRVPIARRSPLLRRRFARPPPIANACA